MSKYKEPQLRTNVCLRKKESVSILELITSIENKSYEDVVSKAIQEYFNNHYTIEAKLKKEKE